MRTRTLITSLLLLISLVFAAGITAPAQAVDPQPLGPSGTWTQVFGDEFEGTTLDTTKWQPYWYLEGGEMNDVPTKASNVSLANGKAVLRLYDGFGKEPLSGATIRTTFAQDRYQVLPGDFVEAKIYYGGSATEDIYNWPGFWTTGKPWPENGEHDISEGLGGVLKTVYHTADANGVHIQAAKTTPPGDWGGAYHTYGLHRKASSADVYWDGVLVYSYATSDPDQPQEVVLTVGKPRETTRTPKTMGANGMRVEYVRAWRSTP